MLLTFLRMLSMFLLGRNRKRKISQESTAAVKNHIVFLWSLGALNQGGFCVLSFINHNTAREDI